MNDDTISWDLGIEDRMHDAFYLGPAVFDLCVTLKDSFAGQANSREDIWHL